MLCGSDYDSVTFCILYCATSLVGADCRKLRLRHPKAPREARFGERLSSFVELWQELNAIWLGQFCGYYMQENIAKSTASTNSERESAAFVVQGLDGLPFIAVLTGYLNWEGIRVVINLNLALFQ
ncbi:GD14047 [Drosophila simulans]|uniref:GD14047 n=1 Tax=Drosophila simulans TaxID=7240 RepID=B4QKZ7_DROSI|nr:GD14047 [Drosophila simulans]